MESKKSRVSTANPSLPNDLLVSCLARVSRLYYPTLSFVSKSFRSLLASPELHQTRSALGCTESCLYVCLQDSNYPCSRRLFTLYRKPYRTDLLTDDTMKKESSEYVLAPLPFQNFPSWSRFVALGSNIYKFGGPNCEASSSVSILDCWSNTWHEAPSMQMERMKPSINVLDGKIYVAGGCEKCDPTIWMEVFDPKTQAWVFVSGPSVEMLDFTYVERSLVFDGLIVYFTAHSCLVYNSKEGKWVSGLRWSRFSHCVIENVLYIYRSYSYGIEWINWYDIKGGYLGKIEGVKGVLPDVSDYNLVRMADYGGKLVVFWESSGGRMSKTTFMCTVIALERRNNQEIWGKVEWHGVVHTDPHSSSLGHALTVTV